MNTNKKERLIGVILAGGKGSRLDGKGKYNHKFNNNTLLEQVYDRIKSQFGDLFKEYDIQNLKEILNNIILNFENKVYSN